MNRFEPSLFISACEASGDQIGAELVSSLKQRWPNLSAKGITGPRLEGLGVQRIAGAEEFSVMGVIEVARKLARIRTIEQRVVNELQHRPVDICVLIDAAGFHLSLAERLQMLGLKTVQLVAPKLWAWGEERAAHLAKCFNLLMAIFPFEPDFFRKHGIACRYVGCPIRERTAAYALKQPRQAPQTPAQICLLPGSRPGELQRIFPQIIRVAKLMKQRSPALRFVTVLTPTLSEAICADCSRQAQRLGVEVHRGNALPIIANSDLAIAASGTVTLEASLLNVPTVVLYSMNRLTFKIASTRVRTQWASLTNILLNREILPEFIQCIDPEKVCDKAMALLRDGKERLAMLEQFAQLNTKLAAPPFADQARTVLAQVAQWE